MALQRKFYSRHPELGNSYKWPQIYFTCRKHRLFPHSWLITRFRRKQTRQVPHVEQGLLTLPSPPAGFSRVPVARSLVVCVMFCTSAFVFSSFGHCVVCPITIRGFVLPLWYLVAIVLSVQLRFTVSYYVFGIFKPFLNVCCQLN